MNILQVYPKDWYVKLELSLNEVNQILDFLDNCEFQGDLKDEHMRIASQYVTKEFFPKLEQLSNEMKGELNGS